MSLQNSSNNTSQNLVEGYSTTATSAGTTTLDVNSKFLQYFTGSTTHTIVLPNVSTLVNGQSWNLINKSTGAITINTTTTPVLLMTLQPGTSVIVTCIDITAGTSISAWDINYTSLFYSGSGVVSGDYLSGQLNSTIGKGQVPIEQTYQLLNNGSTISTIANFFGSNSNPTLVASEIYEIEIFAYFLNSTAGTVAWTFTNSAAPTFQNIHYRYTPNTGVNTGAGAATYLEGDIAGDITAAKTLTVSGTLTDAVQHYAHFKIYLSNGNGTSFKIQATKGSGGTITPLKGSYYKVRKLSAAKNVGNMSA